MRYLPEKLKRFLLSVPENVRHGTNEIRLRVNRPVILTLNRGYHVINSCQTTIKIIDEVFNSICDYSVYSHQAELEHGFITLEGGHRAGICGTASIDKNGHRTCHYISSINIRIARQHIGCADEIFKRAFSDKPCGAIIAGPPCCGKTTILRDLARIFSSDPYFLKVAIVDERSELAASYKGQLNTSLGVSCDVLDKYPKGEGILQAVRTLSPDIIICDEIGGQADAEAVKEGLNAGVYIITSAHACNVDELYRRTPCRAILDTNAFSKVIVLKGGCNRGIIDSISDLKGGLLC